MGITASATPPEPAGASPPATTEPVDASTPPPEAAAPPPPPTTEAADPPDKVDAAASAGADGAADTVVVDVAAEAGKDGDETEEEGECGFCLFMKGGGCKEEFVAWEKCVEEAEAAGKKDDVVELCHDVTAALRKCMDAHADYYEPILRAERAMAKDLEAAAQAGEASGSEPSASSSSEAPEPTRTSDEEGRKKLADEAAGSDKNEDSAA